MERIEGATDGLEPLERHAKIPGGGLNIGMPEQDLNGSQIGASIEQVCSTSVAKKMWVNQIFDSGPLAGFAAQAPNRIIAERLIVTLLGGE